MKKINSKGFVLAETLVVTVFLMVIFGMIYSNFYPLMGEYEKRENYNDVDSIYSIFWLKRFIEDSDYQPNNAKKMNLSKNHFMRFDCHDIIEAQKQETCKNLLSSLQVEGCNSQGSNCNIFITPYKIDEFKDLVSKKFKRYKEDCNYSDNYCKNKYIENNYASDNTDGNLSEEKRKEKWEVRSEKSVFNSGMEDYIFSLPNYKNTTNKPKYRVIASFQHRKDNNNFYSYATIEVNK